MVLSKNLGYKLYIETIVEILLQNLTMYGDISEIQWKFQKMATLVTKGVPSWVWVA